MALLYLEERELNKEVRGVKGEDERKKDQTDKGGGGTAGTAKVTRNAQARSHGRTQR